MGFCGNKRQASNESCPDKGEFCSNRTSTSVDKQHVLRAWQNSKNYIKIKKIFKKGRNIKNSTFAETGNAGHMGTEKSERARNVMFWPGMCRQIESIAGRHSVCLKHHPSGAKEARISLRILDRPWQVAAPERLALNNDNYIVTVDYCSRHSEQINSTPANSKPGFSATVLPST